jgi:Ser/Thr protein kinase RdoA (MazF antagonist)
LSATPPGLADPFAALDPQAVVEAVEQHPDADGNRRFCTGRVLALNSFENRVFQVELEDAPPLVAKFYRPGRHGPEALDEEHDFVFDLDEAGVPVATPLLLDAEDRSVGQLALPQADAGAAPALWFALFDRVPGRVPDELDEEDLRAVGRHLGQLHIVGAEHHFAHRPAFDAATWARESLEGILTHPAARFPSSLSAAYEDVVGGLLERMLPRFEGVPTHRIHGDCHRGNLLWTQGGPVFLDFDDACVGPAVQDVWLLVPGTDAEARRQRQALLAGYREVNRFERGWLELVEPLRALRYLRYSAWVSARLGEAAFRRTFEHFGTVRHWESLLGDLREQRERLEAATAP